MIRQKCQCKLCFEVFFDVQQDWQRITPSCPFCLSNHFWVLKDDQEPFLRNSNNTDFKQAVKRLQCGNVVLADFEVERIVMNVKKKRGR